MIEVLVAAAAIASNATTVTTAAPKFVIPTCSVCSSPNLCLQVSKTDSTDYSCVPRNNIDACDGKDGYNVSYCNEGTSLWGLLAIAVVFVIVFVYRMSKVREGHKWDTFFSSAWYTVCSPFIWCSYCLYSFDDDKNKCYKYSVIAPAKFKKEWALAPTAQGMEGRDPVEMAQPVEISPPSAPPAPGELPPGWREATDPDSGRTYWYNTDGNIPSTWTRPEKLQPQFPKFKF